MGVTVTTYRHDSKRLWGMLGPLAASRDVHKELGGPIYSSPDCTWFVAMNGKQPVGFASLRESSLGYWLDYAYVMPDHRKHGVHKALAKARAEHIATLPDRPLLICCHKNRWDHYKRQGFTVQRERGAWVYGVKQ